MLQRFKKRNRVPIPSQVTNDDFISRFNNISQIEENKELEQEVTKLCNFVISRRISKKVLDALINLHQDKPVSSREHLIIFSALIENPLFDTALFLEKQCKSMNGLEKAVLIGDVVEFHSIIRAKTNINLVNSNGMSLLHFAMIGRPEIKITQYICDTLKNDINHFCNLVGTPLHALMLSSIDIDSKICFVNFLFERRCNTSINDAFDNHPLHLCNNYRKNDLHKLLTNTMLLDNIDIDKRNQAGKPVKDVLFGVYGSQEELDNLFKFIGAKTKRAHTFSGTTFLPTDSKGKEIVHAKSSRAILISSAVLVQQSNDSLLRK